MSRSTRITLLVLAAGLAGILALVVRGGRVEPHARVKLADREEGTLHESPDPHEPVVLIDERFDAGYGDWREIEDTARPFERTGALSVRASSDAGRSFVTLSGSRGALFRIVPVEPSTPYRLEAELRARDVVLVAAEGEQDQPLFPARPWLAELERFDATDEVLRAGIEALIVQRVLFPSSAGREGWHLREHWFRTGPRTRAVVVACTLGLSEVLATGEVDYRSVRFERVSTRRYRSELLARARAEFARGEPAPTGWRARRRVQALLGAELRPAIVLFPGERLVQRLAIPPYRPELETGLGPWRPALEDALLVDAPRGLAFVLSVDGTEVRRVETTAPSALGETRWRDETVDLSRWAGETVEIELAVEGDLPGVFGAPTLRDAGFRSDRPNLLLVSIDTLRADRVGCYGGPDGTTPRLDAFAAQGVRFANATSQAPYTLPAHATLFTGQVPTVHGIQRGGQVLSSERSPVLARILSERGYRTKAMTGGGFLNADFGFDKGFDAFTVIDPLRDPGSRYLAKLVQDDPGRFSTALIRENGTDGVRAFLRESRDAPFFLFLHTYTVHDYDPPASHRRCDARGCTSERTDWRPFRIVPNEERPLEAWRPRPVTEEDRAHLSHLYDDALAYVDELLGGILDELATLGLDESTIVVVTTDHGEELFDRGFVQHGKTLYEELMRVPMLLRAPGLSPRVVTAPAMTMDLAPTLLRLTGIPPDARMQGVDLLSPALAERASWSEIRDAFVHRYALRDASWKLIHSPHDDEVCLPAPVEWELYDLENDAAERRNLAGDEETRLETMRELLERHLEAFRAVAEQLGDVGAGEIDPETQLQLEALGYL